MLVHVLVLGGIAAAHVAADQAHPQVRPTVPEINTILAHMGAGFANPDQIQVRAGFFSQPVGEGQPEHKLRYIKMCRCFGHKPSFNSLDYFNSA
jgi:hypothetical protein